MPKLLAGILTLVIACSAALATGLPVRAANTSSAATLVRPHPGGKPWTGAEIARLHHRIDALMKAPAFRGAHVGLLAIDTVRGTQLYARNARDEFMPASNFKLIVGSASLEHLGTGFTFDTTVLAGGPITGGTLNGDLYLHGGGDAHLTAKDLDDAAAALAARGVKAVSGALITDASYFDNQRYGFGWSWDDLPYYYAPVVTALELDEGTVNIYMTPGPAVGAPVQLRIDPESSAYRIENLLTTGPAGSKDTSNIVRPWNHPHTIELTGTYPLGAKESGDILPAVPNPERYAGDVFLRALNARGITVQGGVQDGVTPPAATTLWVHHSEAMPKLMADFWYPSDNLMGELFLKELGVVEGGTPGTDAHGEVLEKAFLRSVGVNPNTVTIADGSGLSSYDRITPYDLVRILQYDWRSPNRNVVLDALPVAGVRGTLKYAYLHTPAEFNVWAKTGSISHVRTVSGFVKTRSHGPVTFSFLVNDWMGGSRPKGYAALAKARGAILSYLAMQ